MEISKFLKMNKFEILYLKEKKFSEILFLQKKFHVQISGIRHFSTSMILKGKEENINLCIETIFLILKEKNFFEKIALLNDDIHKKFLSNLKKFMIDCDCVVIFNKYETMDSNYIYDFFGSEEGIKKIKKKLINQVFDINNYDDDIDDFNFDIIEYIDSYVNNLINDIDDTNYKKSEGILKSISNTLDNKIIASKHFKKTKIILENSVKDKILPKYEDLFDSMASSMGFELEIYNKKNRTTVIIITSKSKEILMEAKMKILNLINHEKDGQSLFVYDLKRLK